jgi:hypothetical protein
MYEYDDNHSLLKVITESNAMINVAMFFNEYRSS